MKPHNNFLYFFMCHSFSTPFIVKYKFCCFFINLFLTLAVAQQSQPTRILPTSRVGTNLIILYKNTFRKKENKNVKQSNTVTVVCGKQWKFSTFIFICIKNNGFFYHCSLILNSIFSIRLFIFSAVNLFISMGCVCSM